MSIDTPAALADKTVVIVEDEGVTQLQLRRVLTRAGMKVLGVAADGETALSLIRKFHPHLVLMDVQMQGAMNGIEATRTITREQNVCVIIMTAYNELVKEAADAGACGYLVKPVSLELLIEHVATVLAEFQAK
jgi:response regulator NasT